MSSSVLTGLDLVMYLVPDIVSARRFYEQLFEMSPADFCSETYVEYVLPDGASFAIVKDPSTTASSGGAVFGVNDIAETGNRVLALGGSVLEKHAGKQCDLHWYWDPFGNVFALHKRRA